MTDNSVEIRVVTQGAVVVNDASIYRASKDIVCLYVDLASKRAELLMADAGGEDPPRIWLEASEDTLFLDPSHPRDAVTIVEFPEYPGWRVFATSGPGRYSLGVVLVAPVDEVPA